ncbi:hypothetical protein V6N13_101498 [Hibiscus sabdariffa]
MLQPDEQRCKPETYTPILRASTRSRSRTLMSSGSSLPQSDIKVWLLERRKKTDVACVWFENGYCRAAENLGAWSMQCYDSGSPGDVLSNSQEDSGFNTDKVVDDVCVSGEVDMVNEPGLGDNSPLIDDAPLELMSTGGGICEAEVGPLESNGAGAAQSSGSASSEEGDRIAEDDRPIDDNGNLVQENVNAHPMAFQSSNWRAAVDAEYNALLADGT